MLPYSFWQFSFLFHLGKIFLFFVFFSSLVFYSIQYFLVFLQQRIPQRVVKRISDCFPIEDLVRTLSLVSERWIPFSGCCSSFYSQYWSLEHKVCTSLIFIDTLIFGLKSCLTSFKYCHKKFPILTSIHLK